MARKTAPDVARARFARYLAGHLRAGTRPGKPEGEPWTYAAFAGEVESSRRGKQSASPRSISNWCNGRGLPVEIEPILRALFGPNTKQQTQSKDRNRLRSAFLSAQKESSAALVTQAKRDPAGGAWVIRDEKFVLDRTVRSTDVRAALDPQRDQLKTAIKSIAADLGKRSRRLANSPTWGGLSSSAEHLAKLLHSPSKDIPNNLGELYALMLSLGQFLETDTRVQRDPVSIDDPLDASLHAPLSNLVRLAAPWLRGFPTVAAWDDAAGKALVRENLYQPARDFSRIARDQDAILERDANEIEMLASSSNPTGFQGQKAGARAVGDIQNLILASAEVAAKSDEQSAQKPLHVKRALAMLKAGRAQVEQVANSLQPDLRHALNIIIDEASNLEKTPARIKPKLDRNALNLLGVVLGHAYAKYDGNHKYEQKDIEINSIKTLKQLNYSRRKLISELKRKQ